MDLSGRGDKTPACRRRAAVGPSARVAWQTQTDRGRIRCAWTSPCPRRGAARRGEARRGLQAAAPRPATTRKYYELDNLRISCKSSKALSVFQNEKKNLIEILGAAIRGCMSPEKKREKRKRVAVISAKNHKRQRRKRQSVTAKRENSLTPKVLTEILTLPNLT